MFTVEMSNPNLNLTCVMVAGRRRCAMFVNAYVYLLFFTRWSPGSFGKRGRLPALLNLKKRVGLLRLNSCSCK